ncbi:unnamed protein product [Closterium sp. NIES-53]
MDDIYKWPESSSKPELLDFGVDPHQDSRGLPEAPTEGSSSYAMEGGAEARNGKGLGEELLRRRSPPTSTAVEEQDVAVAEVVEGGEGDRREWRASVGTARSGGRPCWSYTAPAQHVDIGLGAAWTMTPRAELLDKLGTARIAEVTSASGHALKVKGAGRVAFKGANDKPVVLRDMLLVPDLKANLISLRKLAKCGVSTSIKGAKTFTGQLGKRVLWDLSESQPLDHWDKRAC